MVAPRLCLSWPCRPPARRRARRRRESPRGEAGRFLAWPGSLAEGRSEPLRPLAFAEDAVRLAAGTIVPGAACPAVDDHTRNCRQVWIGVGETMIAVGHEREPRHVPVEQADHLGLA